MRGEETPPIMAGLSLLLQEAQTNELTASNTHNHHQILNKSTMLRPITPPPLPSATSPHHPFPLPASDFLEACYLCRKRLTPEMDIYMYRGDMAFCSVECRSRLIFIDELEFFGREKCSLAVASSPSSSSSASRHRKVARKREAATAAAGGGGFAC